MERCSDVPPWLLVMRAITGLTEEPGSADNPRILGMAEFVGKIFPDMADYCDEYTHDDIPWCGLTVAFCMSAASIRPVFGEEDTERFLWALAWSEDDGYERLAAPVPGCIVVMERSGGGHVTLFERMDGDDLVCRGGNQGDRVCESTYSPDQIVALVWPVDGPRPPEPSPSERRELSRGDSGPDVVAVQELLLGVAFADGDFGSQTDAAVKGFQMATGLDVDGVIGPDTWKELDRLEGRLDDGAPYLDEALTEAVIELAGDSAIATYSWRDRGMAPIGYTLGMALTYALAVTWLNEDNTAIAVMAKGERNQPDTDVLSYYKQELKRAGMGDNEASGIDTLRHLFVILMGLGPRESSGNHWEGVDQSATNYESDTCESGLFQSSWNLSTCSDEIQNLYDHFWDNPEGWLKQFNLEVDCNASMLLVHGDSGDTGAAYQWLAKRCPPFAVLMTAVGLRLRRQHWGPIGHKEVEVTQQADDLFRQIERLIADEGVA
jgi:uncharacterized protein (TIGR02594 family)